MGNMGQDKFCTIQLATAQKKSQNMHGAGRADGRFLVDRTSWSTAAGQLGKRALQVMLRPHARATCTARLSVSKVCVGAHAVQGQHSTEDDPNLHGRSQPAEHSYEQWVRPSFGSRNLQKLLSKIVYISVSNDYSTEPAQPQHLPQLPSQLHPWTSRANPVCQKK